MMLLRKSVLKEVEFGLVSQTGLISFALRLGDELRTQAWHEEKAAIVAEETVQCD